MSTTDDLLVQLLGKNGALFDTYEAWANAQIMLLAGTIDDPDSFDIDGGKTGPLGYYAVQNVNGDTLYVPCIARLHQLAAYAALTGYGYTEAGVPAYAMRQALAAAGDLLTLEGTSISADPADVVANRWLGRAPISPSDAVAAWIKSSLGYSDAQMTALFTSSRTFI